MDASKKKSVSVFFLVSTRTYLTGKELSNMVHRCWERPIVKPRVVEGWTPRFDCCPIDSSVNNSTQILSDLLLPSLRRSSSSTAAQFWGSCGHTSHIKPQTCISSHELAAEVFTSCTKQKVKVKWYFYATRTYGAMLMVQSWRRLTPKRN